MLWQTSNKKRLNELKDLMVWMQSNAATMKPANDLALPRRIKSSVQYSSKGWQFLSQQNGEQIQIVAGTSELFCTQLFNVAIPDGGEH